MAEFASKGVAGSGLGLGIAGTALGLLNGGGSGGASNFLFGRSGNNCGDYAVSHYELNQETRISELQAQVALRDANIYNDQKLLDVYKYFDGEIRRIDKSLCEQAVYNTAQTGAMNTMQAQIAQLMNLTKLVVPNTSICPGWGNVDVTIRPTETATTPTTPA